MVRARFLGDDLVLLSPVDGVVMDDVMKLNTAWLNNVFTSVRPWSGGSGTSHRVVWVRCYGVPLHLWNTDCFTKVIGEISTMASLVSIDELTLSWEVVEYARLKVRLVNNGSAKLARKVKINNLMCSILIEEEPPGYDGGGYCANLGCGDSSDSVSCSETYVEESTLFMKSGREKVWLKEGEHCRSDGDDGGGAKVGEGDQCMKKSTFPFVGPASKSRDNQGKGRCSVTKERQKGCKEQYGSDPVKSSDLVCEKAIYSNPIFSEVAKVVVIIECSINQKALSVLSKRVNDLKAHLGEVGPCIPAQEVVGFEEYMGPVKQQAIGAKGAKGTVYKDNGNSREGLEVCGSYEYRKVSSPSRTAGSKIPK